MNIPNQITLARLVLAFIFFGLLSAYRIDSPAESRWILTVSFWIFLVAAIGDVVDGYLARSWGQVTPFGRVVDPVVDKIMVCGAFIFFCSSLFAAPGKGNVTGVAPWMVILILFRELAVSAIRSFMESGGESFGANWAGKVKMFFQSATVCVVLGVVAWHEGSAFWEVVRIICVWATVIVTALSLVEYLRRVQKSLLSDSAMGRTSVKPPEPESRSQSAPHAASAEGASA